MKKIDLAVIGGMGPRATLDFATKLTSLFENPVGDQQHPDMLIYSKASFPSRVESFINKNNNIGFQLKEALIEVSLKNPISIGIPCNGAHYWIYKDRLFDKFKNLVLIDNQTAKYINESKNSARSWKILGTVVTANTDFYKDTFSKHELSVLKVKEKEQQIISKIINDVKKGKLDIALKSFKNYIKNNEENIILACTELTTLNTILKLPKKYVVDTSITLAIGMYLQTMNLTYKSNTSSLYDKILHPEE